ncbi:hypothetical protein F511_40801 [Dorcoceras hygrometricum]|uniref:Uncharacterized protein n=1 Tax=Dorcoceras hygrometricum TaxID=472368 RepID=A0A2Z7A663_9LAMI|nr:hypothetical protein F511_40801 [Dorcoceras hygrometricum]
MTFRVVRTNRYNQDLGLIHSTNGNHLENSKEGSSIDHQLLSVLGFDPMSLWGLVVFLVVLFSGNPGFTAGRGFSPAGGAQEVMPHRHRGRGRGSLRNWQDRMRIGIALLAVSRSRHEEEEEVGDLPPPVERMDVVIARFQRMNPSRMCFGVFTLFRA